MKSLSTLLLLCLFFTSHGRNTTIERLTEVNTYWRSQADAPAQLPSQTGPMDANGWIRLHLQLVEQTLRGRSIAGLSAEQKASRLKSLDHLHAYWAAGRFPVNDRYSYRTPIFIDQYDNFCAVGYLVKASGHEPISRMIAAKTNLAYVHDMKYPELVAWAAEHGFSIDELAWIQPGYPPVHYASAVGKGIDGEVKELYADNEEGKLYVGGSFANADSSIPANNIAYVTESGGAYTWHAMGSGVNGAVHAIAKHGDKIYIAGSFTTAGGIPVNNVACWDGAAWSAVGCINGTVLDLAVMNGVLYAAGAFDVCASFADVNLARWDGTEWQAISGLLGRVNTMHVADGALILGGAFSYGSKVENAIRWSAGSGFSPFNAGIANEVNDFELYGDTLYAACTRTSATDTLNLVMKLKGDEWTELTPNYSLQGFVPHEGTLSFRTLCADGHGLMLGGRFHYRPLVGISAAHCIELFSRNGMSGSWFYVDSTINKMVIFKNSLIAGGSFITGDGIGDGSRWTRKTIRLNGIAKRETGPLSLPAPPIAGLALECYPNPAAEGGRVTIRNNFGADHYRIRDLSGRAAAEGKLRAQASQEIALPKLAAGMYLLEVSNGRGERMAQRLSVY